MRNTRIKIVKNKNGRNMYYLGDGIWFARISETEALKGLASGKYVLWTHNIKKEK
jgi:hypothetical protein